MNSLSLPIECYYQLFKDLEKGCESNLLVQLSLWFPKEHGFEGFQASPIFSSKIFMSMEQWWKQGKAKYTDLKTLKVKVTLEQATKAQRGVEV
jgi:hypothetical protein